MTVPMIRAKVFDIVASLFKFFRKQPLTREEFESIIENKTKNADESAKRKRYH